MNFLEYVQQEYRTIDFHNFLVFQQKKEVRPIAYCCKMIERNQIQGLLPMYTKQMDDRIGFYYDISGKIRLVDYLQRNACDEKQGRQILCSLAESLKNLSRYFLQQQFCILDFNYVFMNDAFHVFFPVLPIEELLQQENNIPLFFQQLVSKYFVTEENNAFYDGLLKYLVRAEFQLDEFIKRVQPVRERTPIMQKQEAPMAVQPLQAEPLKVERIEKAEHGLFQKKVEKEAVSVQPSVIVAPSEVNGIKIPGAPPAAEKPKKEKKSLFGSNEKSAKKEKDEKKFKKDFHLFGSKAEKKKEAADAQIILEAVPQIPATTAASVQQKPVQPALLDDATVMLEGEQLGEKSPYLLYQNQRISIYKTPFVLGKLQADYHLEKSFISRIHATILEQDGQYYIRDENSKNHTYLNGIQLAPYTPYLLEDGSRIKLGLEELIFYQ